MQQWTATHTECPPGTGEAAPPRAAAGGLLAPTEATQGTTMAHLDHPALHNSKGGTAMDQGDMDPMEDMWVLVRLG